MWIRYYETRWYYYGDVSRQTVMRYIKAFKRLYVIEEIPSWNPNLRSKTGRLLTRGTSSWSKNIWFYFWKFSYWDLSVYVNIIGGYIKHYRDRYGLECNHVLHFYNGKHALVQTKLSTYNLEEGINNLRNLIIKNNLNKNNKKIKEPDILMVITGSDTAFTTEDGILIVPIGCLKG